MTVEITNLTPFPNMRFSNLDQNRKEFGVFMVKGAWDIPDENDQECTLSDEQEPFVFTDEYHGELNFSALRYPSDFVPYKPTTDVILDATAYAPGGEVAPSWMVGIKLVDEEGYEILKTLRIYGPRYWIPKWKRQLTEEEQNNWREHKDLFVGWELSDPEPITHLPIRYEYAYGGMHQKGLREDGTPDYEVFEENLVGRGWIHPELTDHTKPQPAPQIEDPNVPITEPYKHYTPQGFGPIPPSWLPRRPLGGTYDQNWIDNVHPYWPADYDFAYHNSASGKLKATKHLKGDLQIHLVNLHPTKQHWKFVLPDKKLCLLENTSDDDVEIIDTISATLLAKDTLYLEISENDNEDLRVYTLWRSTFDVLKTDKLLLSPAIPVFKGGSAIEVDERASRHPHATSVVTDLNKG